MQPAEIEDAIQLSESGLSLARVAEIPRYHPSTIWREFKSRGVATRDSHGLVRQSPWVGPEFVDHA